MDNQVKIKAEVKITATIELTEGQLRALDAMVGYGAKAFFRVFYLRLGKHYLGPFEKDFQELFDNINRTVTPALKQIKEIRKQHNL